MEAVCVIISTEQDGKPLKKWFEEGVPCYAVFTEKKTIKTIIQRNHIPKATKQVCTVFLWFFFDMKEPFFNELGKHTRVQKFQNQKI